MHDRNGTPLKVGDLVTIQCRIRTCDANPDYCNVTVETVEPMHPSEHPTAITLNTRQVVLFARERERIGP